MSHDHSHHDHASHTMPGMDQPMCSMNMLFTWSFQNLCIVFPQWRVTGPFSLLLSLLAVVALTAAYEAIREFSRQYELAAHARLDNLPQNPITLPAEGVHEERNSRVGLNVGASVAAEEGKVKIVKGVLYGVQVFYSFFIMLLFMTYNGWIMIAVGVGATLGYLVFGQGTVTKSAACH